MAGLTCAIKKIARRSLPGSCWVNNNQVFVNIPRLSFLMISHATDECGVVCECQHMIKKRNGHFVQLPAPTEALPKWTGEQCGEEPALSWFVGSERHTLSWKIDVLVPLMHGQQSALGFHCLEEALTIQAHIIEANQRYTLKWLRYQQSV